MILKNKNIFFATLVVSLVFASNYRGVVPAFFNLKKAVPKNEHHTKLASKTEKNSTKTTQVFGADVQYGSIGITNPAHTDVAYDNVFHIRIAQLPSGTEQAYLEYDLFGYAQAASVARSLNNQPSIGGLFLSENKTWSHQSELLSENALRQGDNVLMFTAPELENKNYKVKNIKIVYKTASDNNEYTLLQSQDKLYIKGVNFSSKTKKRTIAGIAIDVNQPDFELILDKKNLAKGVSVVEETTAGVTSQKELKISQFQVVSHFRTIEQPKESFIKMLSAQKSMQVNYAHLLLDVPAGAVKTAVQVSVRGLRTIDLPPMNAAMVNVTNHMQGYRLLPHGTLFEKALKISIPFNKNRIPEGYTEKDINVFYFDENKRLWQEVQKDSLDLKKGVLTAKTTHFTDFIAGIIKMPESPETSGYTPTSIKDLKAASPLVGIQSIAPPSANNRGTASTSFAIEIPKGRGGMQPALNLQYDSDGSHSWAGMGWDISVPAVSIETRWGAPRYDAANETESYSIAGEALIPNTHRSAWVARTADKQFYPRREGAFQQIIRKGSSPKNYYWVVKDKSGVASYYGGSPSGLDINGVLQDASGNVGHWALCLQVDLKGNKVTYEYDKKEGELYLKNVYYTGFGSEKGNYSVRFLKNADLGEANRLDVQVAARLGFKQVNNQLLRKIEVRYKNDMIRSYELNYKEGAFKKTLLKSITQFGADGKLFYTNTMDYFDDVRDASGNYNPFGPEENWSVPSDNIKQGFTGIKEFESNHTLAGSTNGTSAGINYRLGIGLPTLGTLKMNTIGAHGGNTWGTSDVSVVFQDLDGDSFPDKIFKIGNDVYYRKNLFGSGQNAFGASVRIQNLSNLGFTKTKSFTWGVDASIGFGSASANAGYDEQQSTNKTLSYFMDFNGDGLIDFVDSGRVYYNRIVNGIPVFDSSSTGTPAPVSGNGNLILTQPDRTKELQNLLNRNPLHDVVRVWQAPVEGIIAVDQTYQLVEDKTPERQSYKTRNGIDKADGVHLYFQKDNFLMWDERITALDYTQRIKPKQIFMVKKGERLYFRLSSVQDGNYDKVIWNPKIEYTQVQNYFPSSNALSLIDNTAKDANLITLKQFDAAKDFLVSQANQVVVSKAGLISFAGTFQKPVTSDHITLKIVKSVVNVVGESILFERKFLASEIVNFDLSSLVFNIPDDNSFIRITLESTTNIDPKLLFINPSVILPMTPNLKPGDNIRKVDIGHSFYSKVDGNYLINGLIPDISGQLKLGIDPKGYQLTTGINRFKYKGYIVVTAKQNGLLVGRATYSVLNGELSPVTSTFDLNYNYPDTQKDSPIDLEVYVNNLVLNEILTTFPRFGALNINYEIQDAVTEPSKPKFWKKTTNNFAVFSDLNQTENNFGLQYKNWGRFIMNGNLAGNTIDQTKLKFENNTGVDPDNFPDPKKLDPNNMPSGFDTSNEYFLPMTAVYSESIFYGGEKSNFIQNEFMGCSRLGEDDVAEYGDFSLPQSTLLGGETVAFDMITESKSKSIGAGAGVGSFGGGLSTSNGDSYVVQTMSDFNGDRFPDYIRDGQVQFTSPTGGITNNKLPIGDFSHSENSSKGGSISGSYSHGGPSNSLQLSVSKAAVSKNYMQTGASSSAEKGGNSVSLGGNVGLGEDASQQIFSDINGDGLSDRIEANGTVYYNSGYGFLPPEKWLNLNAINKGNSTDFSANLGYSVYNGSISGGLNYGSSISDATHSFLDFNSDGLADKITYGNTDVIVQLNMGDRFADPILYPRFAKMNENKSVSYGLSANGSVDIPIIPPIIVLKLTPSFGASLGASTSRSEASFSDVDADGNLDYIRSTDEDNLTVRLSNIKRTNKLKGITNAAGSSFVMDYELLKPSYENPSAKWVLQTVDVFDGYLGDGIDHAIAKFSYENPYQDRRERDFYGFEKVIQQQMDAANNTVFATTVQEFYNQDHFRKNVLKRSYTLDKNGKMRQETTQDYTFVDVATQTNLPAASLANPVCDDKRIFVALVHTNQKMFEGGSQYLETNTYNQYDANGNIVVYQSLGNGTAKDKVTANIAYYESAAPYFGGIAKQIEVYTTDGLRRKRSTTINANTAEVTQIKNHIDANQVAITDLEYDAYGNLQKRTNPTNYKNQRMTVEYTYDPDNHQFMTQIKDAFGYQNKIAYDYRFGSVTQTTDRNDQSTNYTLDNLGRIQTIQAPYEIASGKPYTIAYAYFPTAKVPYAQTKNYDPELNKDIETYTYTDGLGRVLQVKKTASLFVAPGSPDQEAHIVSGKIIYDGLGRPTTTYYPTTTTTLNNVLSSALSGIAPTKTEYDEVGRATKVTLPDGSSNKTAYALSNFKGIPSLQTTQTDALGKTVQTHTDAAGKNLASIQNNLVTQFDVNALGETIQVIDAMSHTTTSTYDWLGRRTVFAHPDAGTTTMQYDATGNVTRRVTQDLKNTVPNGGAIVYEYDYTRLEAIKYPKNPQNNVQYNYGKANGTPARRGRVWFVQDATGGQEFFYGKLGEVEKEIRTLRITPTDIQTYISQFEYDTWNRIQKMTYPDGEVVDYRYNRAGNLQSMQGIKESHSYDYIKQLSYDEFEQRKYLNYGNGTQTQYTYDPTMRRLQQLQVNNSTKAIMKNQYQYDLVGNVLGIKNTAPVVYNTLGGPAQQTYEYDDFYRLKQAKGSYEGEYSKASYELQMSYNDLHNITKKNLVHTQDGQAKGYVLDYSYQNPLHPNAPSGIAEAATPARAASTRTYTYDGNGNPTSYSDFENFRRMNWDEENRLMGINDNGRVHQYTYDASGERVLKSSGDSQNVSVNGQQAATMVHAEDYTGYVSAYFVINKGKFTKHYFEGAGRIVSKLGTGTFAQPVKITAGGVNYTALSAAQQQAIDRYNQSLGMPPGPPTQMGMYASPVFTGSPYPSAVVAPVNENQEPPQGWPRKPYFNPPGDVPGPPAQYGPPLKPDAVQAKEGFFGTGKVEKDIFYFHADHLGSTSYISDANGQVSQHVEYIAFGEVFFEEHSSSFKSPYLFNGKELDRETNLSFYGARYLDMKTSLWLSSDAKSEHDLSVGSYVYSFNNPIRFVDPDGNWPDLPSWKDVKKSYNEAKAKVSRTYNDAKSSVTRNYNEAKKTIGQAVKSTKEGVANGRKWVKENEKAITNVSKGMQDFGDAVAVVGYGLTLTGIGAEIGVPLAALGNGISTAGSVVELGVQLNNEDLAGSGKTVGFMIADKLVEKGLNKVLPGAGKAVKEEGFNLGTEILTQGAGLKVMVAERVVDKKLEGEK